MTVLEILTHTSKYFSKNGIENPRRNIELLLAHVLDCQRLDLYLQYDSVVSDAKRDQLRELVRKRATGYPVQYLIGEVEFFGHSFLCDERALIPRPETELLVELGLKILRQNPHENRPRILDVGTGSGVIALSLALEFPQADIEAVDISEEALALASENARRLGLENRVSFSKSDILSHFASGKHFELIISNLPYIPTAERPTLAREVQCEPLLALDGGHDGLQWIGRLIHQATGFLARGGYIALEIGYNQAQNVQKLLEQSAYTAISIERDYQQIERLITARYG